MWPSAPFHDAPGVVAGPLGLGMLAALARVARLKQPGQLAFADLTAGQAAEPMVQAVPGVSGGPLLVPDSLQLALLEAVVGSARLRHQLAHPLHP